MLFTLFLLFGYLFLSLATYILHLATLFLRIKNKESYHMQYQGTYRYEFCFLENVIMFGALSLTPIVNIILFLYYGAVLMDPVFKSVNKYVNEYVQNYGTKDIQPEEAPSTKSRKKDA